MRNVSDKIAVKIKFTLEMDTKSQRGEEI